jgi:hypothetical protein
VSAVVVETTDEALHPGAMKFEGPQLHHILIACRLSEYNRRIFCAPCSSEASGPLS